MPLAAEFSSSGLACQLANDPAYETSVKQPSARSDLVGVASTGGEMRVGEFDRLGMLGPCS